ncbi:GGDEF domain-containing protein [Virgisporangium aurantiacum]|uniref:GGDEF domain-containing protein n=1 Tax=Virgisporangium aurantiacum TaxID=175570 RepID=A0A8J3ZK13_9ACTN|nr:GGDEF domain-containing protein [Virgisporangium aurantiacum]GIJ64372.1 hypothetical protein Vau01_118880 [Virgisporangium aurantiacum]
MFRHIGRARTTLASAMFGYRTRTVIAAIAAATVGAIAARRWRRRELDAARSAVAAWRSDALHDPLTHLPNRRAALIEVNARLYTGERFLFVLVDLDDFKAVNDTYGHPTGDDLLTVVAARLRAAVPSDGLVARLGGDEFLVLLTDDGGDPSAAISPVLSLLTEPVQIEAVALQPRASAGVAQPPAGAPANWRYLIVRADRALYRAKATTDGVAVYDSSLDTVDASDTARPHHRRRDRQRGPTGSDAIGPDTD